MNREHWKKSLQIYHALRKWGRMADIQKFKSRDISREIWKTVNFWIKHAELDWMRQNFSKALNNLITSWSEGNDWVKILVVDLGLQRRNADTTELGGGSFENFDKAEDVDEVKEYYSVCQMEFRKPLQQKHYFQTRKNNLKHRKTMWKRKFPESFRKNFSEKIRNISQNTECNEGFSIHRLVGLKISDRLF